MPLLARALERAGVDAPVTGALGRLIAGELPLDEWVALVRATVPAARALAPPAAARLLAKAVAADRQRRRLRTRPCPTAARRFSSFLIN